MTFATLLRQTFFSFGENGGFILKHWYTDLGLSSMLKCANDTWASSSMFPSCCVLWKRIPAFSSRKQRCALVQRLEMSIAGTSCRNYMGLVSGILSATKKEGHMYGESSRQSVVKKCGVASRKECKPTKQRFTTENTTAWYNLMTVFAMFFASRICESIHLDSACYNVILG